MKIDSLKDLERLIRLCQKTGVYHIKVDGLEFQVSPKTTKKDIDTDVFPEASIKIPQFSPVSANPTAQDNIATEELTEEQLLYYSARPESAEAQ